MPGHGGGEGGTRRKTGFATRCGFRHAKCRVQQFRREMHLEAEGLGDVPGVHDIVDEMEADRLPRREDRSGRELGQRKLAVQYPFRGERGQ